MGAIFQPQQREGGSGLACLDLERLRDVPGGPLSIFKSHTVTATVCRRADGPTCKRHTTQPVLPILLSREDDAVTAGPKRYSDALRHELRGPLVVEECQPIHVAVRGLESLTARNNLTIGLDSGRPRAA